MSERPTARAESSSRCVEAHIDSLARAHRDYAVGRERMQRQWQQARLFIDEGLSNKCDCDRRPGTLMRHLVAPLERPGELHSFQRGEGAGCPDESRT